MTYTVYDTVPPHLIMPTKPFDPNFVKWVNPKAPPPVGTRIRVNFNRLGTAVVKKYFIEENFLGLMVSFDDPPEWYCKQNGFDRLGHIFGPEFELVDREFAFDVQLFATIRVTAGSVSEARALLKENVECASANFGSWPDGGPILGEVSVTQETPDLIEIDGEAV